MNIKAMFVVLLASMVVVVGGTVITVYFTHPRDDAAYLASLHQFGKSDGWDKAFKGQTDGYFVLQAEDACEWLADQPAALWRTGSGFRLPDLTERYALTTDEQDVALWGSKRDAKRARMLIAEYAFADICGARYEFHRPHDLWRDSSDG